MPNINARFVLLLAALVVFLLVVFNVTFGDIGLFRTFVVGAALWVAADLVPSGG